MADSSWYKHQLLYKKCRGFIKSFAKLAKRNGPTFCCQRKKMYIIQIGTRWHVALANCFSSQIKSECYHWRIVGDHFGWYFSPSVEPESGVSAPFPMSWSALLSQCLQRSPEMSLKKKKQQQQKLRSVFSGQRTTKQIHSPFPEDSLTKDGNAGVSILD